MNTEKLLSISLNRNEIYLLCFPRKFLTVVFSKSQQVVRRYILGSIVDSEKNYVDALKRILEVLKYHAVLSFRNL